MSPEWPMWELRRDRGVGLMEAPPWIWLTEVLLDALITSMPFFPSALVSTSFRDRPEGHYEPGHGSVGAILRFSTADGRRAVYRIIRYDPVTRCYEARWPD